MLLSHIRHGQTINRAWMELQLQGTRVDGLTVDLGSSAPRNFEMTQRGPDARLFTVDASWRARPHLVANLEDPLPLACASVDSVLLLNVLEHLYHYEQVLCEIGRALRPGGQLILFVPFLIAIHTARRDNFFTDDYFRYSGSALRRLLSGPAKFSGLINIRPCAFGPFAAGANLILPELRFGWLQAACAGCAFLFDGLLRRLHRGREGISRSEWVMGYFVEAIK